MGVVLLERTFVDRKLIDSSFCKRSSGAHLQGSSGFFAGIRLFLSGQLLKSFRLSFLYREIQFLILHMYFLHFYST